jgi:hypothetical protein
MGLSATGPEEIYAAISPAEHPKEYEEDKRPGE